MDIQFSIEPLEILKWVGLVFVAGSIGYFGRYLSILIIGRPHKRRAEPSPTVKPMKETAASEGDKSDRKNLKLEKKVENGTEKSKENGRRKI